MSPAEPVPAGNLDDTLLTALVEDVRIRLATRRAVPAARIPDADLARELREAATARGVVLGVSDILGAMSRAGALLGGLGPLDAVAADPALTDVLVNGDGRVYLDRGNGLEEADLDLGGENEVRALAVRLASLGGRRLDEASPYVDARLPGGVRLHAVLPPLAPEGTHLSLRWVRRTGFSLEELVAAGTVPPALAEVLCALVRSRAAFLVSGGTGAGKTTLLGALLSLVPPRERLLLVEDVSELAPRHPHVVRLEARRPNVEGRGGVGLDELVRQALRMRPDRLVVGECRGPEVRDLLAALNTGHEGGCGTVHANAPVEVPARLEALGSLAGLSPRAVRVQVAAALDVIVHLRRDGPSRRVVEVAVVRRAGLDGVEVLPALALTIRREPAGQGPPGRGAASRGTRSGPAPALGPEPVNPGWQLLSRRLGLVPAPPGHAVGSDDRITTFPRAGEELHSPRDADR